MKSILLIEKFLSVSLNLTVVARTGRITTSLYVHTARTDLVDNFVKTYEAAYAVDEHRSLNLRKVLKNLTITRSPTDDSISASTTTDENSVSSTSGIYSALDSYVVPITEIVTATYIGLDEVKHSLQTPLMRYVDISSLVNCRNKILKSPIFQEIYQ